MKYTAKISIPSHGAVLTIDWEPKHDDSDENNIQQLDWEVDRIAKFIIAQNSFASRLLVLVKDIKVQSALKVEEI